MIHIEETDVLGVQLRLANPQYNVKHIIPARIRQNYDDLTSYDVTRWHVIFEKEIDDASTIDGA